MPASSWFRIDDITRTINETPLMFVRAADGFEAINNYSEAEGFGHYVKTDAEAEDTGQAVAYRDEDGRWGGVFTNYEIVATRVEATPPRLDVALDGYLSVFRGPWGIKASEEDALLGLINAVYPEFPRGADGINALRANPALVDAATRLYELGAEGGHSRDLMARILPVVDVALGAVFPYSPAIDAVPDHDVLLEIAEEALNAFFKVAGDRIDSLYPGTQTTGDVGPGEFLARERIALEWVKSHALNNSAVADAMEAGE